MTFTNPYLLTLECSLVHVLLLPLHYSLLHSRVGSQEPLIKNPRDKLQILTLAKQMYPRNTDSFINHYEEAVQRPFGYLLVDLKTTTQDNCRLRTNVLPGEERFDNSGVPNNISQELLQYLKQQNLMTPPVIPVMQKLQDSMDGLLSRSDLGDYERAKHYMQLQNKYLTFKQQLNSRPRELNPSYSEEQREISSNILPGHVSPLIQEPVTLQSTAVQTPMTIQATAVQEPMATQATPAEASLPSSILTPPSTVPSPTPKRKKPPRIRFKNYLDDDLQNGLQEDPGEFAEIILTRFLKKRKISLLQ